MKFNFKKIASSLASMAMLGSTVGLAAAASYPAPFVDGGAADVAVVYGSNLDLSAVTDITTSLSSALAASGGTATTVSGDAYPLFTNSNPLQLNTSINSVRTVVSESNLPSILGDTDFSGNVDATTTFKLTMGSNPRVVYNKLPSSNDDPTVGVTFTTNAKKYLYNATATFSKVVNLTHADSEGEDLMLFGQDFVIATNTDGSNLVLFKSAQKVSLSVGGSAENPSEVVTVGGDTFTVELVAASDTAATVKVTDSTGAFDQKEINEAASKKIRGLEVAVDTADESTATNTIQAQLIIGANKLKLTDGSEVLEGTEEDSIEGTNVDFTSGDPGNMSTLVLQAYAADTSSDAIRSGEAFLDPVFGNFRLAVTGLSIEADDTENREIVSLGVSGNDKVNIGFTNWQANTLSSFEFINNESSAWGKRFLGDSGDWVIQTREMAKINDSAFAVVGNEETGALIRLRTLSNSSGSPIYGSDSVVFENVFDTSETWSASITAEGTGTISIAGEEYAVTYRYDKTNGADNAQFVRLNYPDSTGADDIIVFPTIETKGGANLALVEPILIQLDNWDGTNSNATKLRFPDGDGYTDITAATHNSANHTWTINGIGVNLTDLGGSCSTGGVLCSTYPVIGKLTYNITTANKVNAGHVGTPATSGVNTNNSIVIALMDPSGNTTINGPAMILFEDKDENNVYEAVVTQFGGNGDSNNGIGVSDIDFTWNRDQNMGDAGSAAGSAYGASGLQQETDDDLYSMMDLWGTVVTTDRSTSDQYTAELSVPSEQVTVELYVDSIEGTGSATTLGDIKVMDDELATSGMQTKNLISVGGSCVNTLSSTLLGGSAGCGASWTASTGAGDGEWVMETYANPWASTKVATLLGGWEQGDTANAATYMTTQEDVSTDVGTKLKGSTATGATVVTSGTA